VKPGDLVQSTKHNNQLGIVVEVFADLAKDNPWIRVLFTHPKETYQWVKQSGLILMTEEKKKEDQK
tara:strand:+ start:107 stop:304 length:198 start_codon:yes stop_codon:yes gene_type:complete